MARKVLIGVLSKRERHNSVEYEKGTGFSTKFSTTICVPKVDPDEIFVVVTEPTEEDSEENKNLFSNFKEDIKRPEIHYTKDSVHQILIKNNVDNDGYLKILYRELYDKIQDGDEIYLDVTGGFRPIPLVLVEVVHYVQQVKNNVVIKNVYYGEYNPKKKEGNFYSVGYFLDFTEWAIGVQNYVQYADASYLKRLVTMDSQFENSVANRLVDSLDLFSNYLKVCQWINAKDLYEQSISKDMNEFFGQVIPNNILEKNRLKDLEKMLKSKFEMYKKNPYRGAVEWCHTHGNYQQELTLLNEFFQDKLRKKGYVKTDKYLEELKKIVEDYNCSMWEFTEINDGYELLIYTDSEYQFYVALERFFKSKFDFEKDTATSVLDFLCLMDKNHVLYEEVERMFAQQSFRDEYKTFEWFLSRFVISYLKTGIYKVYSILGKEMKINSNQLNDIVYSIDVGANNWRDCLINKIEELKKKTFLLKPETENYFLQYRRMKMKYDEINEILKVAESKYKLIRLCDLKNDKIPIEKKVKVPFREEVIKTQVTKKFFLEKEKIFSLLIDWNVIREYRNFIDHAQMVEAYSSYNFIEVKDTNEFKRRIENLLVFIEE